MNIRELAVEYCRVSNKKQSVKGLSISSQREFCEKVARERNLKPVNIRELAVGYCRVSSKKQSEKGLSIPSQREFCEKVEKERKLKLVNIIEEVESGSVTSRDGFNEILKYIEKEEVKYVIVMSEDRLSRDHLQLSYFFEQCRKHGVKVITRETIYSAENFTDKIMITLKGLFSEHEVFQLSERTQRGIAQGLESGRWSIPHVPFGYTKNPNTKMLEVDSEKVEVIREIFTQYISKPIISEVKKVVNSKHQVNLSFSQIHTILENPVYIGVARYGVKRYDHPHTRIISDEIFEEAQKLLGKRRQKRKWGDEFSKFVEEHEPLKVMEIIPQLALKCSRCDSEMVKNGKYILTNGILSQRYKCTNESCGKQETIPNTSQVEKLENPSKPSCPFCLSLLSDDEDNKTDTFYNCQMCGREFYLDTSSGASKKTRKKKISAKRKKRGKVTVIERVFGLLKKRSYQLKELYEKLPEHSKPTIRGTVYKLLRKNKVERIGEGTYRAP